MRFDLKTLEFDRIIEEMASYAGTAIGQENVRALTPSADLDTVLEALHETAEGALYVAEGLEPSFGGIDDIREALKRARIQALLAVPDLLAIRRHIAATKRIRRELARLSQHLEQPIDLEAYCEALTVTKELADAIDQVMDDRGEILDTASVELKKIRGSLSATERRIKETLEGLLKREAKKLTEQLITFRHNRYVIPVKVSDKNRIKGTIMDYSSSGETAYIEPDMVRDLSSRKLRLEADERREIERILYALSAVVHDVHAVLKQNNDTLGHLDFVFAKARYGYQMEAVKPDMSTRLHLIKARHPLINRDTVVPNTITFDEGVKTMIITGSNTGGKTVTLKTTGLLACMAQAGLLIPVNPGSTLPCFKQIRADIGDEQSIEQSLSTFSSHMKNIVDILNTVTDGSLVLLDELGSGTDPNEGSSLAMSLLDALDEKNLLTMATTHYPELKAYAYTKTSIVNASVEFDENSLQPTFRLLLRTPGESHAFLIGERLGLPSSVIEAAKSRALVSETEVSDLIHKLKIESKRLDAMIQEQERLNRETEALKKDTEQLRRTLQQEKETLKERLRLENHRILESLKAEALALIQDLEQLKTQSFKAHEVADAKYRARSLGAEGETEKSQETRQYEPGDTVYLFKFNRHGELLKKQKKSQWLVKMGSVKSVFKEEDFEYAEASTTKKTQPQTPAQKTVKKSVPGTLDLRGMRAHEAEIVLQKYLDDCAVADLPFASIVHGFGTLALRNMVKDTVSKSPLVASFRDGESGEGGQGVTVIYFG
ncbi:MAG: endonuclease MutS2 [Acholeplasmatales bacterium]|nr:MAG: endonuclease MutS2 [Acholeplasmatales bacterium]